MILFACIYIYIYIYVYSFYNARFPHGAVYIYICMYVCIYIHTYTPIYLKIEIPQTIGFFNMTKVGFRAPKPMCFDSKAHQVAHAAGLWREQVQPHTVGETQQPPKWLWKCRVIW